MNLFFKSGHFQGLNARKNKITGKVQIWLLTHWFDVPPKASIYFKESVENGI